MAIVSTNMGLRIWNLTTDPYDHAQLADNWDKVDNHDHTEGRGVQIPTGGLADGSVTEDKIAPGVIPSTFTLEDGSVTTPKLADDAVTAPKLADNSVGSANIIDGSIQNADIGNSQVGTTKLQTDSVDNTILKDDAGTDANRAVTTNHIRNAAVTADKVSDGVAENTGISTSTGVRRGYISTTTIEAWAGTPGTYANLPTPDQISNLVVPSNGGLIHVVYRALWKLNGASNDARVTLFVGAQQLKSVAHNQVAPVTIDKNLNDSGDRWSPVTSTPTGAGDGDGMFGAKASTSSSSAVDNALPQAWSSNETIRWAPIIFEAPGGTYDISIRYKTAATSGGTLSVRDRRLRVWVVGF